MPKVNDLKAYYKDIATKAGVDKDKIDQALALFEDATVLKTFTDGFKPLPDYSHDLDDVRNRSRAEKDTEYASWFEGEKKKFDEYVAGLDRLKLYESTYGPLDSSNPPDPGTHRTGGKVLTQEDIDKLFETKLATALAHRDSAVVDLLEVREQHLGTFKKPLDTKAFENAWKEHPEWGGSMKLAYEKFVEPETTRVRTEEFDRKLKEKYEEGIRDGYSRRNLPTDIQSKEFSPIFDRKVEVDKMNDAEQERHSRESFFEGLRETNKQPV